MKKRNIYFHGIGQIKVKAVKNITAEEPIVKQKREKLIKDDNKKREKIFR